MCALLLRAWKDSSPKHHYVVILLRLLEGRHLGYVFLLFGTIKYNRYLLKEMCIYRLVKYMTNRQMLGKAELP